MYRALFTSLLSCPLILFSASAISNRQITSNLAAVRCPHCSSLVTNTSSMQSSSSISTRNRWTSAVSEGSWRQLIIWSVWFQSSTSILRVSVMLPLNVSLDLGLGTAHDTSSTRINVHGLSIVTWHDGHKVWWHLDTRHWLILSTSRERERALISRRMEEKTSGDSRRPSWSLGLRQLHLKYYMKRALKCLSNLKPDTAILGSSHTIVHVILRLTDTQVCD